MWSGILNYQNSLYAKFENKFLYKKSNQKISLEEMKMRLGGKDYDKLYKIMNPTIASDKDTLKAYTVPTLDIPDVNKRKRYIVENILDKKLKKYNNRDYQKFIHNYLYINLEFCSCFDYKEGYDVIKEINSKYSNIVGYYNLIIVIEDQFEIVEVSLKNNTVRVVCEK